MRVNKAWKMVGLNVSFWGLITRGFHTSFEIKLKI